MDYAEFLRSKSQYGEDSGFDPVWIPGFLFDFQQHLVEWAVRKGRCAIFADCGLGKGQPYDALVLSPTGWRSIGSLVVGDQIIASDGKPYSVTGVYHKDEQDTYRLHFSDGCSFVVDDDHLHICRTNNDRQRGKPWRVMSTSELRCCGNIRYGKNDKSRNYDIPVVADISFESAELPIKPYLLGVLLGDGHIKGNISISSDDDELLNRVRDDLPKGVWLKQKSKYDWKLMTGNTGNQRHQFRQSLKRMGLLGLLSDQKFVPHEYLFASSSDRLDLLRGLMDTDGYIMRCGTSQFYSTSESLSNAVIHLVRSLGGIPTQSIKQTSCNGKKGQPCHVVTFSLKRHNPFFISRKAKRWNPSPRDNGRWIDRIEFECKQPTVCIAVASPDQSYVTENFIVTHNTPMQLVWAQNIVEKTNGNVLIVTPLAVSHQTVREGQKFGIKCKRSNDGKPADKITVTNYERLHLFNSSDYEGVICDESSILKNFDGVRKAIVTEFLRTRPYRLLCTATAAPNDYPELGTASEALGELGFMDMLNRFFRNENNTSDRGRFFGQVKKWRFKKHAQKPFWQWVCSWARALRKPSDMGFQDGEFILPDLLERQQVIENTSPLPGELFVRPAIGLQEQREELRMTLQERCEKVSELLSNNGIALAWCHLNAEGDLLEKIIPDAVQVKGSQSDDKKESLLADFSEGNIPILITKPKIGGFGLNWQHCAHMTFFPSHSYEQYYQGVRRCWRFGQKNPVIVDVVTTGGGLSVLENLQNKARKADRMFTQLIDLMNDSQSISTKRDFKEEMEAPVWL